MYLKYALMGVIPTLLLAIIWPTLSFIYMFIYLCLVNGRVEEDVKKAIKGFIEDVKKAIKGFIQKIKNRRSSNGK